MTLFEHGLDRPTQAVSGLRIGVATLLVVHGIARATLGIVDDFGGFLGAVGFPLGLQVAWGITIFEVIGGAFLALGRWTRPIAVLFCLELVGGIALVHGSEGWFVVGAGRNGMEYSVLLIAVLVAVIYSQTTTETEV